MTPDEVRQRLQSTLDDVRLSRSEKRALKSVLGDIDPDPQSLAIYRSVAFDLARRTLDATNGSQIVDWLESICSLLVDVSSRAEATPNRVNCWFSPDPDFGARIAGFLDRARRTVDVCVYNITHDRISDAIASAHLRGLRVRVLTDDETRHNRGSDIVSLLDAGVDIRFDATDAEMHHKFAVFDSDTLLTGSSNWTRAAETRNRDNIVVTDDLRLVEPFARYFGRLWTEFGP